MRHILSAVVAAAIVSVSSIALAAPAHAPAPAASSYNWTGFFVGANVGGALTHNDWQFVPSSSNSHHSDDFTAGLQGGYNWQFAPDALVGLEGNFDWLNADAKSVCPNTAARCITKVDSYGDVSGRLGWVMGRTVVFVKGGLAVADKDHLVRFPATSSNDEHGGDGFDTGYLFGFGVERAFTDHVSLKLEFNTMGFRDGFNLSRINSGTFVERAIENSSINVLKLGINYNF